MRPSRSSCSMPLKSVSIPSTTPSKPKPFRTDDEILEGALQLFRLRSGEGGNLAATEETAWHARLKGSRTAFGRRCAKIRLVPLERELLAALILERLGLAGRSFQTCSELVDFLGLPGIAARLNAFRCLSEEGRLYRERLITHEDPADDLPERPVVLDPGVLEEVLWARKAPVPGWAVTTESELHEHLYQLTRLLGQRADLVRGAVRGYSSRAPLFRADRQLARIMRELCQTLELHADWKLPTVLRQIGPFPASQEDWIVILVLLGKELGHVDEEDFLFRGEGLACAACHAEADVPTLLHRLGSRGSLARAGWIQPCSGAESLLDDTPDSLRRAEFELTAKAVESLGLSRTGARAVKRDGDIRDPRITFDRLVFPRDVMDSFELLLGQARDADVLFRQWGLAGTLGYGRGITAVLWGPPGVGKTAAAEAIAAALDKPILAVNYAEIQDCYVGQTEKNIVRAFHRAQSHGAVLFWDEADGMFYSRDDARYAWERRHVNVLLQEIESFEGMCLLATNRKDIFDSAFERRITLKIELRRPEQSQRRAILERLIPSLLPVDADVDLDTLAALDLTGGELKNVVLNAARIALRDTAGAGPVSASHFDEAVALERNGRLREGNRRSIGFHSSG